MINHNNQANPSPNCRGTQKLYIAYVNNKDEAMMFNVPKGYTAFLFEYNRPVFYIKSCDEFTNQISFFEYEYTEVVPAPMPDPSNFVTRDDMLGFKDEIMQSIATLLASNVNTQGNQNMQNNQVEVRHANEQHIPKTTTGPAKPAKGQSR